MSSICAAKQVPYTAVPSRRPMSNVRFDEDMLTRKTPVQTNKDVTAKVVSILTVVVRCVLSLIVARPVSVDL